MTDDDALVVGNLASRVLAAIEETEQRFTVSIETLRADLIGQAAFRIAAHTTPERARETAERITDAVMPSTVTDIVADRDSILRRCVADRKIVALADGLPRDKYGNFVCRDPSDEALVDVLTALAEGYGITTEPSP